MVNFFYVGVSNIDAYPIAHQRTQTTRLRSDTEYLTIRVKFKVSTRKALIYHSKSPFPYSYEIQKLTPNEVSRSLDVGFDATSENR